MDRINERLDYLVIGDTPSLAWKHGSYGGKIEQARLLIANSGARLRLISEGQFIEALALVPPTNPGSIDARVVVATYKFVIAGGTSDFDADALETLLREFDNEYQCHVRVQLYWARTYVDLFRRDKNTSATAGTIVACRLVRQLQLDAPLIPSAEALERGFEMVRGVDGSLSWFEHVEGTATTFDS